MKKEKLSFNEIVLDKLVDFMRSSDGDHKTLFFN